MEGFLISQDWRFFFERVKRTMQTFGALVEKSETALKAMWAVENRIMEISKKKGKMLSPSQSFVLSYFRRNTVYLHASHVLGTMAFSHPTVNLQRTVYETILRGYLFIVDPEEATLYYSNLRTDKEEHFLKQREFYGHSYLCKRLFKAENKEAHRKLYRALCISSHAEIKGLLLDFPAYREKEVEDRLRITLSLSYGNLQMVTEMFFGSLDSALKTGIKDILKEIVISLENQVPLFEPNLDAHASKLRLKRGNFMTAL